MKKVYEVQTKGEVTFINRIVAESVEEAEDKVIEHLFQEVVTEMSVTDVVVEPVSDRDH